MTCACGVEAWVRKQRQKEPALFSFRTSPAHEFRSVNPRLDEDW